MMREFAISFILFMGIGMIVSLVWAGYWYSGLVFLIFLWKPSRKVFLLAFGIRPVGRPMGQTSAIDYELAKKIGSEVVNYIMEGGKNGGTTSSSAH
jgi:hypothetical protein